MAYTDTDLASIDTAIRALMNGTRLVRLSIGDKSWEYGQADLKTLRELRAEILAEVQPSTTRPRFFLTQTDKGL